MYIHMAGVAAGSWSLIHSDEFVVFWYRTPSKSTFVLVSLVSREAIQFSLVPLTLVLFVSLLMLTTRQNAACDSYSHNSFT